VKTSDEVEECWIFGESVVTVSAELEKLIKVGVRDGG
jgi:hypothetical protein